MLILTRRPNETVMIGTEITVTVLGVKGNQVRLGVNAPVDVPQIVNWPLVVSDQNQRVGDVGLVPQL